jgi:hypothetical protein
MATDHSRPSNVNRLSVAIEEMVSFFLPHCADPSTIGELWEMASDPGKWREAHKLFDRIGLKTLRAVEAKDHLLACQYVFEEICAKTLYNMADHRQEFSTEYLPRFDHDAPFWVVPIAVHLAHRLGLRGLPCGSDFLRIDDQGLPGGFFLHVDEVRARK